MALSYTDAALLYARKEYPKDIEKQEVAYHAFLKGFRVGNRRLVERQKPVKRLFTVNPELKEAFDLWLEYRKEIKKPFKSAVTERCQYEKLVALSDENGARAMEIVEQSRGNGWQALYPLKMGYLNLLKLSDSQRKFRNYLLMNAPLVARMRMQPTDEELEELRTIEPDELLRILKVMNNRKYITDGRNSVFQTIQEIRHNGSY